MKITAIKQQVKTRGRYSVFVDDEYSFSLSEDLVIQTSIHSGLELDRQQVEDYKKLSVDDKVYGRALRYVAMRPRTTWEMRVYLERHDCSPPLLEITLNKLSVLKLLDDEKYAAMFVNDRLLLRPTSRRKIILELKKKHVSDEAIQKAFAETMGDDQAALADVITKKRRQSKYQDDNKLMQYLVRQGFNYGDVKTVLKHTNLDYED